MLSHFLGCLMSSFDFRNDQDFTNLGFSGLPCFGFPFSALLG